MDEIPEAERLTVRVTEGRWAEPVSLGGRPAPCISELTVGAQQEPPLT